jgi:hypothetical protein
MTPDEYQIVTRLTDELPDFGDLWIKYLETAIDDEEGEKYITLYLVATEFSKYIINLFIGYEIDKLRKAFSEVELMASNSSEYVSEVALVGFIESILSLRSHKGIPLNAFDAWLGENSKKFWY